MVEEYRQHYNHERLHNSPSLQDTGGARGVVQAREGRPRAYEGARIGKCTLIGGGLGGSLQKNGIGSGDEGTEMMGT